jgi:hypothetical protein
MRTEVNVAETIHGIHAPVAACCQISEKFRGTTRRGVKKYSSWLATRSIYTAPTGFDENGSADSLPLYGNEAIAGSRRAGGLIAFPDCRNAGMPLTPSPSREISSNFQPGIEIYAPERRGT